MARYSVAKYFGHVRQDWSVVAESKEEAWNIAEEQGVLNYQTLYYNKIDNDSKGYVVDLDEKAKNTPPITKEMQVKWLIEAEKLGMKIVRDYDKDLIVKAKNEETSNGENFAYI